MIKTFKRMQQVQALQYTGDNIQECIDFLDKYHYFGEVEAIDDNHAVLSDFDNRWRLVIPDGAWLVCVNGNVTLVGKAAFLEEFEEVECQGVTQ